MKKILPILLLLVGFVTPMYLQKKRLQIEQLDAQHLFILSSQGLKWLALTAGEALMNRIYAYHMIDDNEIGNDQWSNHCSSN